MKSSVARPAAEVCLGPLRLLAVLCLVLSLPEQAAAHGVYIFAWPDGPLLCTQSYFSKSSRVAGGEIRMTDSRGTILDSGRSDDAGLLCFSPPREARDLAFIVIAGQGHKGEFLLPAAEVERAVAARGREEAEGDRSTARPASSPVPDAFSSPAGDAASGGQGLSPAAREEAAAMIEREISALRRTLAEQKNDASPGLRDILGGLGWIFGLAAAGALYYSRNKGK